MTGPSCEIEADRKIYNTLDEVSLATSNLSTTSSILLPENGADTSNDLELVAFIDRTDGSWQWYNNGAALIGENMNYLDVSSRVSGSYTVKYTVGNECLTKSYTVGTKPKRRM